MCCYDETPDFEIRIKGHVLVKVNEMGVRVDGKDFHGDLKDLAAVVEVLHEILDSANEARKPRLVMNEPILVAADMPLGFQKVANTP